MKHMFALTLVLLCCSSFNQDKSSRDKEIISKITSRTTSLGLKLEIIEILDVKDISEQQYTLCAWDDIREDMEEMERSVGTTSKFFHQLQLLQDSITTVASKLDNDKKYGYHVKLKCNVLYDGEWKKNEEMYWVVAKDGIATPCSECKELIK